MSTSSGRRVRGETQTSADSFCRAVGREFLNEITIQGPAPASVDPASVGAAAEEEEASVAPRKCRVNILTWWCHVDIGIAQCLALYDNVKRRKVTRLQKSWTFIAESFSSSEVTGATTTFWCPEDNF